MRDGEAHAGDGANECAKRTRKTNTQNEYAIAE
jgi:hypothetical protein